MYVCVDMDMNADEGDGHGDRRRRQRVKEKKVVPRVLSLQKQREWGGNLKEQL